VELNPCGEEASWNGPRIPPVSPVMYMNKQEYFNEFKNGTKDLFFIVTKDYTNVLKRQNFFFYMNKDNKMSMVGFITYDDAEDFLRSVFPGDNNWKIISLDCPSFDIFLDSLDPEFRGKLIFELI
jgi:hypothetical protein